MRVALVNPHTPDGNFVPSMGLLVIAAVLRQRGVEPAVFDLNADPEHFSRLVDFNPDVVGLTAVTSSILSARRLAARVRQELPQARIAFGGPHPSASPQEVIAWPEADFVVVGEGERAMDSLCAWIEARGDAAQIAQVPNLWHKEAGLPSFTFRADFLHSRELDELPMPAYDLLDIDLVASRLRHGLIRKGSRALPFMATRGCPHLCAFCCRVMGQRIRRRSPERVLDEIEHLVRTYALDELYMEDDNFTASKRYAMTVLNGIRERGLPIALKFANGMRIDTLDDELLDAMRLAGCHSVSFGLESGSPRVLSMMRKHLDLDKVRSQARMVRKHGFLLGANMIIGFPGEREADIWEGFDFFQSLQLDSVAVVNLIPFPGTQVRDICLEHGYLTELAKNWDNYYFDINAPKILIETPELPAEQLRQIMSKVFVKLYTDPRRVLRLVRNMSLKDIATGVATVTRRVLAR